MKEGKKTYFKKDKRRYQSMKVKRIKNARRFIKALEKKTGLRWADIKECLQNASEYVKLCKIWEV